MINVQATIGKKRYWREFIRRMTIFENAYARKLAPMINRQFKAAAEYADRPQLIPIVIQQFRLNMLAFSRLSFKRTAVTFGKWALAEQDKLKPKGIDSPEEKDGVMLDAFYQSIDYHIRTQTAQLVVAVEKATIEALKVIIQNGLAEGLSISLIAKKIRGTGNILSKIRAERIARTEVHTAAALGVQKMHEVTNIPMEKEWQSALDSRTRQEHISANGQRVPISSPFMVGGEPLDYPGDMKGSAWNVVNCRCVSLYHTIKAKSWGGRYDKRIFRRAI